MKLKWIALLGLGLLAIQANAEQAGSTPPTQADANRENALKSDKLSPRQRAELVKAESAVSNKQAGNEFLASNKAKSGVTSLPSGVQYKILAAGKGKKPAENSSIVCRYKGKLMDGTDFDKSDEKKPLTLKVAGLVPGLKEAVKLMSTGSKWEIVVPPKLAYGDKGYREIGPNAVLIYTMEIVSVK